LNAFIERWIQSLKYEALNHLIVFGKEHFDFIASEYVQYFLGLRPHQGLGNILLPRPRCGPADGASGDNCISPVIDISEVKREQRLGGLLKHFYRNAA
jgi:hypothetical protein